jgi:sulfotransferase
LGKCIIILGIILFFVYRGVMGKTLENKTFYFMGGLPRSGSTVLTAILNQHPEIYASPQSELVGIAYGLRHQIFNSESWQSGLMQENYLNTIDSLGNLFYSNIEKPVIIDKNRAWGTPGNQIVAESLNQTPKTILVLRPIIEILSSFVRLAKKNPDNFIDEAIANQDLFSKYYRNVNDVRCDYLMRPSGEIDQALLAIGTLVNKPEICHLVWYEDLISDPQACLSGIYQFLDIYDFKHNFSKIKQLDKHDDSKIFGIKDLHLISSSIKASRTKPELVLSDYAMTKYANALDFIPR